jgi:hypothetical protein
MADFLSRVGICAAGDVAIDYDIGFVRGAGLLLLAGAEVVEKKTLIISSASQLVIFKIIKAQKEGVLTSIEKSQSVTI